MENQLIMEFVAGVESRHSTKYPSLAQYEIGAVRRKYECACDEIRCRELMKRAVDNEVVVALDNLRLILQKERKGY